MPWVLPALLFASAAPACESAQASRAAPTAYERRLSSRLTWLERQLTEVNRREQQLQGAAGRSSDRIAALAKRLDAAAASLDHVNSRLSRIDSHAAAAASAAESAGTQAADLARRLAVLEKRFEYHLKHDPGSS
jgi:chromosome segregation ATPase